MDSSPNGASSRQLAPRDGTQWLWQTLAHHQARDRTAARQALALARRREPAPDRWIERIAYDRLRREVEALPGLTDKPAPQ